MKFGDLQSPPPSIDSGLPLITRMRRDCELVNTDGWKQAMVAFNWLLTYAEELERRVADLEARE